MGESYNGIHALTDLFADVKIPNKVSGVVAGERLLYLSLNLVGPVCLSFSLQKKFAHCFFVTSTLTPLPCSTSYLFAFLYLYLHPRYP